MTVTRSTATGSSNTSDSLSSTTLQQPSQSPSPTLPSLHLPPTASESSSSASSDSDDSASDSSDDSSDDDDGGSIAPQLAALLLKAKYSAQQRAQQQEEEHKRNAKRGEEGDGLAGNEDSLRFGEESSEEEDEEEDDEGTTPKASTSSHSSRSSRLLPPSLIAPLSLSLPSLSTSSLSLSRDISLLQELGRPVLPGHGEEVVVVDAKGKRKAGERRDGKGEVVQGHGAEGREERWGMAPLPRLSKKEIRAKQPHTAGSKWFNMPATPLTPQLKRELDALRLASAVDSKKFMRGGAKKEKVGEFFQIGHVLAPNTRATSNSQTARVEKQSFLDSILSDEKAKAYAKKRTKEVLAKGMQGRKRQRAHGGGVGGREMGGTGKKSKREQ